ncbi:Pleiotropic drug resistance protein 2 [Camellia lanceoleosa]|uniref:Pleiotropic drug resistance protein 2 n=1 Tax=Camellia lanceoleosa TaxID=1840588 RepID=A0ACC0IX94_9ERIC|nr:Pleiotropic drug resistance protein 2 [Camellia lanceoleosa]
MYWSRHQQVFPAVIGIVQYTSNVSLSLSLCCCGKKAGCCYILLGGFIVAQNDIEPFMIWGYYISPVMYGQNALVINEFLDKRWSATPEFMHLQLGKSFSTLTFLNPLSDSKSIVLDEDVGKKNEKSSGQMTSEGFDMTVRNASRGTGSSVGVTDHAPRKGMLFPFQPLSLAFNHINYYVDMPTGVPYPALQSKRRSKTHQHPVLNTACKDGKSFTYNSSINIVVTVAINGGLMTLVLPDADKLDLYLLFQKWKELVEKARAKQLQPHDDFKH